MENHLLVIDDDDRIRELLQKYLLKNGFLINTARDTAEARQLMSKYVFDLIIVDNMMPNETGVEFLESIRKQDNYTPTIMLTALGEVENKLEGLSAGADDYITKPFNPEELILRIKNILKRTKLTIDNTKFKFDNYIFDFKKNELTKDGEIIKLTDIETKILSLFIKNSNNILSREELSEELDGVEDRTIDVQILRLRKKIEENIKNPKYLKTIRNKGYIFSV